MTGKPVLSDLRSRKKSLPVTAALNAGTPAARRLAALLRRSPSRSASRSCVEAAALVEEAGGRAWAEATADQRVASAEEQLATADDAGRGPRASSWPWRGS